MRDADIRQLLYAKEFCKIKIKDPSSLILDEFTLCQGTARIDIAVINGILSGYEIKSNQDTLDRLPLQEKIYSKTLDKVTIVVGSKHKIKKLDDIIPSWWGIIIVESTSKSAKLVRVKPSIQNPNIDGFYLSQLLWREEALRVLQSKDLHKGLSNKRRIDLCKRIAENFSCREINDIVRTTLKARVNWRVDVGHR